MHWTIKTGILLVILATPVKWFMNAFEDISPCGSPLYSLQEARQWQVYFYPARVTPAKLTYRGQKIEIKEAWVERRSMRSYFLVWFPYRKDLGGYDLCFTLKKGKEIFHTSPIPFWVAGDEGHGFAEVSSGEKQVFCETLEQLPSSLKVSLIDSWNQPRPKDIEVTIDKK